MTPPPRLSAFFERKRRLAYIFAWASMAFLALQLSLGFLLEFYSHPRAAAAPDGSFRVVHRAFNQDDVDGSRLLTLDAGARTAAPPLSLPDRATALIPGERDVTVYFGDHAAVYAGEKLSSSTDLKQKWDVQAAVDGWIFGWHEGNLVARRRDRDAWAPEAVVAKSAEVERMTASIDGTRGPVVAWREANGPKIKTVRFDGTAWVPGAEFDIAAAEHWDLVATGGRDLLIVYNRDDRTFQYVTLRLECCPGCASPVKLRRVRFAEPNLLIGRKVTGISAVASAGRLRLFITRMSALLTASLPLSSLEPDPGASKLASIATQASWRHAAALTPALLMFCSFSMIFIGFTLFRERGRLASGVVEPGPRIADFPARAMAYILDHTILIPAQLIAIEVFNVGTESGVPDLDDPHFLPMMASIWAVNSVYYFIMEWRFGWTIGKRILGLKVTGADGARLTFQGALLRNVIRYLDSELASIVGAGFILASRRRQRLGDLIARTIVVQDLPE